MSAPDQLELPAGVLDVWLTDLNGAAVGLVPILDGAERSRADRFARRSDRDRWIAARAQLRMLTGRYLGVEPASLRFDLGTDGKPGLDGADLRFNLSHVGSFALYAYTVGTEVGVDLEVLDRPIDALALTRRVFGETEATRLRELAEPERHREFLRMWVRHEAELKCRGTGLGGSASGESAVPPALWTVELDMNPRGVAALSAAEEPQTVRRRIVPERASEVLKAFPNWHSAQIG